MVADIVRIGPERLEALRGLLSRDPVQFLLPLAVLEEYGLQSAEAPPFAFHAQEDAGGLKGGLFVGGDGELAIPFGDQSAAVHVARGLADGGMKLRSAMGEKGLTDAVLRAFGSPKTQVERLQKLLTVSADDLGPFVAPQLRVASEADVPELVELSAAAVQESLGVDARATEGAEAFRARVAARVRTGRAWVMRIDQRLCFKVDMGARCRYGAELENPYMAPDLRRRGLATLALGQVCRQQLSALPRLTTRVDEKDEVLLKLCRRVGFIYVRTQRLWVAA
jgi:hypothetical protein